MLIRSIRKTDNSILAKVIRDVFIEHKADQPGTVFTDPTTDNLFDYFQKERAIAFVAEENDLPVGCCGIYPTVGLPEGCVELVKFYIHKTHRGRGIGKELITKCIHEAKYLKYNQIYIESLPQFSRAVKLYEKLGFKSIDKRMGNSGHYACNIWMTLKL